MTKPTTAFSNPTNLNRKHAASLILLVAITLALGLFRITAAEPHTDSPPVYTIIQRSWSELLTDFFTPEGDVFGGIYPPFYFFLIKLYGGLIGSGLAQLRFFSVLALVGLVLLSWLAFPLIYKNSDERFRFLFALMVAVSPVHLWWAQTLKYPMWFYFVSACSLTAAIWFIQEIDRRRLILFSLSVAIVIYTHYLGLVFSAALFLVLGFIIIFRRSKAWWQQIVSSTLLVGILISPLLLVLLKSVPSLVNTGYHFKAGFSLSKLIRAILVDWGFGYGLIPGHNLFAKLAAFSNALISRNWPDAVSIFQDGVGIALAATIVLGLNLAFTGYHLKRGPSLRVNSTILLGVPLLTFGVSQITNLNFFPLHFGIIAWGLLAFIVIGWVQSKHPILPFVLGICMLVVNGISLNHYYANLENKYPGKQLIIDYLNTHQPEFETAFVDDWITHVRGPAITPDELHPDIILLGFDSMANIPLGQVDETGTIVFLAGTWETIQAELEAVQATHSNFSWQLLETWPSLELAERSIHVVEVTYTAAD